jgi:hypothetical protein
MPAHRTELGIRIARAVNSTVQEMATRDNSLGEAAGHTQERQLLLNSSFLYRDKQTVKTLQSTRRLVARMTLRSGRLRADQVRITNDLSIKTHCKILAPEDVSDAISVSDAVGQELGAVGDLVFVLIGTVKGLRRSAMKVESRRITELRLDPSVADPVTWVEAGIYSAKKIVPIEELVSRIARDFEAQGGLTAPERGEIARVYDLLVDQAITDVVIPSRGSRVTGQTILGQIVGSLREQFVEYGKALAAHETDKDDKQAFNEVLRIAYNFSTDVLPLIHLFMSVCDLKPLVFWCTVDSQWKLYQSFAALPWSTLGRKEKLAEYQSIVAQARNYAFHHILPFDSTIEANLTHLDVRAEVIRLFSEYGQKQGRGIRLKDQAIADVLSEFSRAKERPVSTVFWRENLGVMESACELAESVLDTLLLIHSARPQR